MSADKNNLYETGWKKAPGAPSLQEVHASVAVPVTANFWRKMLAFAGPGLMVAVGYMDPGNWATDLAGGAKFGYTLLAVVLISNFMAILLQHLNLYTTLYVDEHTRSIWAEIVASCRRAGRPLQTADAWIAASARQWRLPLVTADVGDFEAVPELDIVPLS